jgi:hypothetical protein
MTKTKGISKKKAIVAAARRLGVLLYTLMKNKSGYEPGHCEKPETAGKELAKLALSAQRAGSCRGKDFCEKLSFPLTKNIGLHGLPVTKPC